MKNLESYLEEQSRLLNQITEGIALEYVTKRNPVEIGISSLAAATSAALLPLSVPTLLGVFGLSYLSQVTGIGAKKHHSPVPFMWPVSIPALISLNGFSLLSDSLKGNRFYRVNNPENLEDPETNEARLSFPDYEGLNNMTSPMLYLRENLSVAPLNGNINVYRNSQNINPGYNTAEFSFQTDPSLVEELDQLTKEYHEKRDES